MSSTSPAENLAQADVPSAEQVRRRRLVAAGAQDLRTAVVRREAVTPTGQSSDATTRIIDTHARTSIGTPVRSSTRYGRASPRVTTPIGPGAVALNASEPASLPCSRQQGHLEPHLREFLNDHPDPERNVFVMMRFLESPQLDEVHASIRDALAARAFEAVRADGRDYTGELWSNIEVYMTCCRLGIAVFEDIESRDFNPNVSLELGYMLGRRKRCLILKEQRLPDLPADVVHRLYKPFDVFNIGVSVTREVARWVDVDLGIGTGLGS